MLCYHDREFGTYAKVACAKRYDRKTPLTAADLLNDRLIPFFDSHDEVSSAPARSSGGQAPK